MGGLKAAGRTSPPHLQPARPPLIKGVRAAALFQKEKRALGLSSVFDDFHSARNARKCSRRRRQPGSQVTGSNASLDSGRGQCGAPLQHTKQPDLCGCTARLAAVCRLTHTEARAHTRAAGTASALRARHRGTAAPGFLLTGGLEAVGVVEFACNTEGGRVRLRAPGNEGRASRDSPRVRPGKQNGHAQRDASARSATVHSQRGAAAALPRCRPLFTPARGGAYRGSRRGS